MKYLWNLPLIGAVFSGYMFVYLTMLSEQPRFGDAGLGASLATFLSGIFCALLLGAALVGCVNTGGFDWLSVGRTGALAIVLAMHALLVLLILFPIATTIDTHNEHIVPGSDVSLSIVWLARFAFFGLPIVLIGYAGWLINAPIGSRDGLALRCAALGAITALGIIAAIVTHAENERESAKATAQKTAEEQKTTARIDAQRTGLAALSDADPLDKWFDYVAHVGMSIAPDVHVEAIRRLAARPTLEADLATALNSKERHLIFVAWSLIDQLDFAPSKALEGSMRASIAALAEEIAEAATAQPSERQRSAYLYDTYAAILLILPRIVRRMAVSASVDLRDAVAPLQKIIVEAYPTSGAADFLPRLMAEISGAIDAALAARPKSP